MNTKQLARIALWKMALDGRQDRKVEANVQATFYGSKPRYPEAIPSEAEAAEMLREIVRQCRTLDSRYWGDCSLTDEDIAPGTAIYYYKGEIKLTLAKAQIDAIIQ